MKYPNSNVFLAFILFINIQIKGVAQSTTLNYEVNLSGGLSSDITLPFWLEGNRFGTVPNSDYLLLNTAIYSDFSKPNQLFDFSYKTLVTGYIAEENKAIINEMYVSLRLYKFLIDVGNKYDDVLWNNLSSSNGNILKSINARALPGINIKTDGFIELPFAKNWLRFKGNFAHYFMNDNRPVDNVYLHHKSLFAKLIFSKKTALWGGIDHYAQWGGESEEFRILPTSANAYLRTVFGLEGDGDALLTDQLNAVGNHLGAYLLQFDYTGEKRNWSFYWSHPFEDTSGREFKNVQDGLYGIFVDLKKPTGLVSSVLGEFTYTKNMSGPNHMTIDPDGTYHYGGADNYLNHGIYTAGWTYFGKTIGSPYFTATELDVNGVSSGVVLGDNRLMAFNIGVEGNLKPIKYKALLSHTTYYGWFDQEYEVYPIQFSGIFEAYLPQREKIPFQISASASFDTGTYKPVNFGGFITLSKRGRF